MSVPLLDLAPQHDPLQPALLAAMEEVVVSGDFIMGPQVQALEEAIAAYCGAPHAIGVSSGTDALLVALMALGVGPGDLVLTTPFSFFATAGVVARIGARALFVDIEPTSYNLSPSALLETWQGLSNEERQRVKAIIPVHLFGQCAAMAELLDFAHKHGIPIIEDAAQSLGATYCTSSGPRKAGTMGEMGCFSFFPSKNLGGFGDGGMVITRDEALAEQLRILRVHGAKPKYHHALIGGNFRLDSLQAAVLLVKLPELDRWHTERRNNAARYQQLFQAAGLSETLTLPASLYEGQGLFPHIYNQYVVRAPQRDALQRHLQQRGIGSAIYYPIALHLQACFEGWGYQPGSMPESERAAREVLALPIYPGLSEAQQEEVVSAIKEFYS